MYPVPLLDNPQGQTCEAGWETRSDLSFSSPIRMMVNSGLAGVRVQPCPRKKLSFWLLASSSWLNLPIRLEASGWWQGAGDRIQAPANVQNKPGL